MTKRRYPREAQNGSPRLLEGLPVSKKASLRRTSPERDAADQQARARSARRRTAASVVASATQNVRQFSKAGTRAIRAHIQSQGQRRQASRDSR